MTLDRPANAPETADGMTAPAGAATVALGSAVHGDLAQPSPPFLAWDRAGGES